MEEKSKLQLIGEIAQANNKNLELIEEINEKDDEIERLNNIINRIKSIYSSLCFSAPENNYIFIEQLGEVLQELKGSDKE